jgi:AcrR family transcriptional regulator
MTRKYELKRRAERQAETRQRIVEATVDLHTTIGPRATSISAIADRARVQRHTVYAHFPDSASLFEACSAHWRSLHPIPDVRGLEFASALFALYGWYGEVADALVVLARDAALYTDIWTRQRRAFEALSDELARPFGRGKFVRAAVGHALAFETWRTLTRDQGLSTEQAVDLMRAFVDAARRGVRSTSWRQPKAAKPTPV